MKIAVVSHDAGGSELLTAYIKKHIDDAQWSLFAKKNSPFEDIAHRNGLDTHHELDISGFDALFFTTGWQEKVERVFVQKARQLGIPTFAFLDHWSSYRERFDYPNKAWKKNLPDFTVLSDKKAERIANEYNFPHPLRIDNIYLHNQLTHSHAEEISVTDNLLFLSEPTDAVAEATYGDKNYWGFTQESALVEILKHFKKFNCSGLHIRLHPSEKKHQYNSILKKFPQIKSQIYPADFFPLEKDLLRSKLIIGFDTMALYTAALLGKPVISYLPSTNREFLLPLPGSHQLRNLDNMTPKHLKPLDISLESNGMKFAEIKELIKGFNT